MDTYKTSGSSPTVGSFFAASGGSPPAQSELAASPQSNPSTARTPFKKVRHRKTHCKRGHPLSGVNLYIHPDGGRRCRECTLARHQTPEYREHQREYSREYNRAQYAASLQISKLHPELNSVALGKLSEIKVAQFFCSLGYMVELQHHGSPFDLLVSSLDGATCRVEIRTAVKVSRGHLQVNRKHPSKFDLFVRIAPDGEMIFEPSKLFWENPTNPIVLQILSKEAS